ncbi:MAG: DNA alkylation repair protein [Chloroflexi bacterium]|nr:DNA alkylation repair protein [Chloroflexota bacterium]
MPAIQPERLKRQAVELGTHFDKPSGFIRELKHLFEFYANRAQRPGQSRKPASLIPTYNVSAQVIRRILSEITPHAETDPEEGLALAEALWAEPVFESRLLATHLIGRIPVKAPDMITDLIESWVDENDEDKLLEGLAVNGLAYLRQADTNILLSLVGLWISEVDLNQQKLGLRALLAILNEPGFENLPKIYKLITPLVEEAPKLLRPYLIDVIRSLVDLSTNETAIFLQNAASGGSKETTRWLIRRSADMFPEGLASQLRRISRTSAPE